MKAEELTPEWINQTVARFGRRSLAPCAAVEVEPIPNERVQVHRLRLRYADGPGDRPATLILKTPFGPTLPGGGRSTHDAGAREAYFFRRLAAASGLWTARCYAVDNDPVSGASILLFEDLATLGLRQGDRGSGIRGSEAETVVTQLAVFQARFWGARQPQAHREILSLTQNVATAGDDAIRDYYREAWPVVEACGLYDLSPEVIGYGRGLLADPNRARRRLAEASQTLLHGDAHVENLFFDDRPASPAFALIDWEDLAVGHGLLDIAWLVTTSVHTRDAGWEPDLVRAYFDALLAAGVQDYRWEACQADYAWALASVFVQGVLNCSVEANLSAAELALERELGQRFMAACERARLWELA
ncbi:MAG TPA: phosphotransferase [Anaerolineales bacterium]|nr:phosphotransferase [Anaerolineales bacterium]